jgi:hypothetical protein
VAAINKSAINVRLLKYVSGNSRWLLRSIAKAKAGRRRPRSSKLRIATDIAHSANTYVQKGKYMVMPKAHMDINGTMSGLPKCMPISGSISRMEPANTLRLRLRLMVMGREMASRSSNPSLS